MQLHSVKGYKKEKKISTLSPNKSRLFETKFADSNFRFDENVGKFSKRRLENTVGKVKMLMMMKSNFSFSYSIFKRLLLQTLKNTGLVNKST